MKFLELVKYLLKVILLKNCLNFSFYNQCKKWNVILSIIIPNLKVESRIIAIRNFKRFDLLFCIGRLRNLKIKIYPLFHIVT